MIYFLADQSKITIKLKNTLVLPSPDHSFRKSCLLLMCGTGKLQCQGHVCRRRRPAGSEEGTALPVVYLSLRHHNIHSPQGEGRSRERMPREVTQEEALSNLFYASANVFPLICQVISTSNQAFLGHYARSRFWTLLGILR